MKRSIFIFLFLAVLIISCQQESEQTVEKRVPVKIYNVQTDSIAKYLAVPGSISASEDVILYSKVSERIEKIFVKPGDRVSKNHTLAVQYNEIFKQSFLSAETAVKTAEVQQQMVKNDYERMKKLFDQKAISSQQFDQISTQYKSAQLASDQAKSQMSQVKEQYENSFVKAPFEGIVASVYVEQNQMLPAGQPVIQLINPASMKAKIKVASKDANKIYKGQFVKALFPSTPEKEYMGYVDQIDQAVDPISKSLQIEVKMNKSALPLKSGIFGEFYIQTEKRNNSVILPENALQSRTEVNVDKKTGIQNSVKKYFVFAVSGGRADLKEVKTGISDNGRIEITSGIGVGDSIIVMGQNIVKSGQKVKVIE
ncbi:MAG: efflux RND transporter periplasmic adaptor subunit [Bacteroidetes bacterium]|nr:efflux RND transporter periplasmic adaptor subunit [Bacteroidota bacterium]